MAITDLLFQLKDQALALRDLSALALIWRTVALLFVLWFISWGYALVTNYRNARKAGLPIVVTPINPTNVLFMIFQHMMIPMFGRFLPEPLLLRLRLCIHGWEWEDKIEMHQKLGDAFILVTSNRNELWVGDPVLSTHITQQRRDFTTHEMTRVVMGFSGQNVITSDGDNWTRQRRLVAPHLNERISDVVWNESLTQAAGMRSFLLAEPGRETRRTVESLRAIAINVLARVGYGTPKPFAPYEMPHHPDQVRTYVDCISLVCELIPAPALVPAWLAELSFMPAIVRALGAGIRKLPILTAEMLEEERRKMREGGKDVRENLMSMLVRLSDEGKKQEKGAKTEGRGQFLSDEEISGNMLLFSAAGFDTNANTMGYAIAWLAAYPAWQAWVQEELDEVMAEVGGGIEGTDYSVVYPKLQRCLAVMLETLRLCPPVVHLSRYNESVPQMVPTAKGTQHLLVGPYNIMLNNIYEHHNPAVWGDDSLQFRPARWLIPSPSGGRPQLLEPKKGIYTPWSAGPRVCPGMKMAQVEFVAVFATILSTHRAEVVLQPGQTEAEGQKAMLACIQDSMAKLTLLMNRPKDVHLRWVSR